MNIRHAYSPRIRVALEFCGPGRTKQSFKDECDINRIMQRYQATGVLDFVERREAQFADVSGFDFQAAMQLVADAKSAFMSLPSNVRERFSNDPAQLLHFVNNPSNLAEAVELGIAVARTGDPLPGAGGAAGGGSPVGEGAKAPAGEGAKAPGLA